MLKQWREEVGLNADLLSDSERQVAMLYGAAQSRDQEKATRLSFLIAADGTLEKIYQASDAAGHADEVLADL